VYTNPNHGSSQVKVLVTGGAGYIGSHTCKILLSEGFTPVTLDNLVSGNETSVKWGPFYKGDIHDKALLNKIFVEEKIAAVIHFAAHINVGESVHDPLKYYDNNVTGSLALIGQMIEHKVYNLIFSSSCTLYGNAAESPITENCKPDPINPYGETKKIIENLIDDLKKSYPLKSVILRYFNAAGAGLDGDLGETSSAAIHLVPLAIKAALDPEYFLPVFGGDYATPDGTCIRDYVHVEDVAMAHVLALKMILQKPANTPYVERCNLGFGKGYSVLEIIREVEKITHLTVKYKMSPRREGDPPRLIAETSKAKRLLGWQPQFSDLQTIIRTAYQWHLRSNNKQ
jgi:UDP-arabinose 4-epimerase